MQRSTSRRASGLRNRLGGLTLAVLALAATAAVRPAPVAGSVAETVAETMQSPAQLAAAAERPDTADDFAALAARLQARYQQIERQVAPSVVAISVAIESRGDDDTVRSDDMTGRKLTHILERTTRTVGTGAIISADGLILTNEHVVGEAQQIWVTTDTGRVYPAYVVASDPRQDLAILRMPAVAGLKPVTFAPPNSVSRGHLAIALGNPYGLANEGRLAMSVGEVSATGRSLSTLSAKQGRMYNDLIQTTAEINPGNSGGPLFDIQGRVIGIITAVVLPNKNVAGVGFALPVSPSIMSRINTLKAGLDISYGDVGFSASAMSTRQRRAAGITTDVGVRIEAVDPRGPSASLRDGDVLLTIDETPVNEIDDFSRLLGGIRAGVPTRLTFARAGKPYATTITPRPRPRATSTAATSTTSDAGTAATGPAGAATPVSALNQRFRWRGMLIGPIPANWEFPGRARPDAGLMVLATDADAHEAFPPGTILQSVGGRLLRSVGDLQNALASVSPEACSVTLWSGANPQQPQTLSAGQSPSVTITEP